MSEPQGRASSEETLRRPNAILLLLVLVAGWTLSLTAGHAVAAEADEAWSFPEGLPRIHVARGLWWRMLRIHESGALMGGAIFDGSFDVFGSARGYCGHGRTLGDFPTSRDRLEGYNTIVIVGCRAGALSNAAQQRLAEWVRGGGGLMVTGGFHGFGEGNYHGTPLEDVLPVIVSDKPDLTRLATGSSLEPTRTGRECYGPTIPWKQRPSVYYVHTRLEVKDGAQVLIQAAGHPLVIRKRIGKGRASVFAGTVCGEPPAEDLPFWEWSGWPMILSRELTWLVDTPVPATAKGPEPPQDEQYRKRLQELRGLAKLDLTAFGEEIDEFGGGPAVDSGKATFSHISRLAKECSTREYALAVMNALAESGTKFEPRQGEALFSHVAGHLSGVEFVEPAHALASSGKAGRVALGLRALARAEPGAARPYILKYVAGGLSALPERRDDASPPLSAESLSGKDERLRLAAVRAGADCADPEFLTPFKQAAARCRPGSSSNPIVAEIQRDLKEEIQVTLCLMGDGEAAAGVVRLLIHHELAIERNLDIIQRPMYVRTPELVRQRKRAQAEILLLKARSARLKRILARFPESGIPRLAESARTWEPFGAVYLQACLAGNGAGPPLAPAPMKALRSILRECRLQGIRALCARRLREGNAAELTKAIVELADGERGDALFALSQIAYLPSEERGRVIETGLAHESLAVRASAVHAAILAPADRQQHLLERIRDAAGKDARLLPVVDRVTRLAQERDED